MKHRRPTGTDVGGGSSPKTFCVTPLWFVVGGGSSQVLKTDDSGSLGGREEPAKGQKREDNLLRCRNIEPPAVSWGA